eukprot:6696236-Lingulodinium_polyedra.AAC.1
MACLEQGKHSWIRRDRQRAQRKCRECGTPWHVPMEPGQALAQSCAAYLAEPAAQAGAGDAAAAAAECGQQPALLELCRGADGASQLLAALLQLCQGSSGATAALKVGPELLQQLNRQVERSAAPTPKSEAWHKQHKRSKELWDKVTAANRKVERAMELHQKAKEELDKHHKEAVQAKEQQAKLKAEAAEADAEMQ